MSSRKRNYVPPTAPMYRAASYDREGRCISSTGPYATKGAAMASRSRITRRGVVVVRVEECFPIWAPVDGTEIGNA